MRLRHGEREGERGLFAWANALDEKLYWRSCALMLVVLDGVADVEGLGGVDVREVFGHIECNTVEDFSACVVHEFELDVLKVASNKFACAEIHYSACAEYGFGIARSEGVEASEGVDKRWCNLRKCDVGVNVKLGFKLIGLYVGGYIFLEFVERPPGVYRLDKAGEYEDSACKDAKQRREPYRDAAQQAPFSRSVSGTII